MKVKMKEMKLALVDVETTGSKPPYDRVIDVGIILVDDDHIVSEWDSLINPECSISSFITELTGISNTDLANAPTFAEVYRQIDELLADRIFVAHNVSFDYSFIKHEFSRLNQPFQAPRLCTVRLSRALDPLSRHHNLDAILARLNITLENRHRALPDARAIFYFLQNWRTAHGSDYVEAKIKQIYRHPAIPPNIPSAELDKLPSSAGVYTFYDESGTPLYIGKSLNVKERVMSHFYSDSVSAREQEINHEIRYIDSQPAAGELEALLLESRLIKASKPIYNRKLRQVESYWVAKKWQDDKGYYRLSPELVPALLYLDHGEIELIAKSKNQLKKQLETICREHALCFKLCGLEPGSGACFGYHVDQCAGACIFQESPSEYNHRVLTAFANTAIADWPYSGPVVIHERNEALEMEAYHLVADWSVIKTSKTLADLEEVTLSDRFPIDLDEYMILKNYLVKNSHRSQSIFLFQREHVYHPLS